MYVNITANDASQVEFTNSVSVPPGEEFSVSVTGDFDSGTLTLYSDTDGGTTSVALDGGALTTATNPKIFLNPANSGILYYQLTGATAPDLDVNILAVRSRLVSST